MNDVVLSSFALKELAESFDWYEERSEGLGKRFINTVDRALISISKDPALFPKKKKNYREMVMETFPYVVVFEHLEEERIINILHVFHTSRNPKFKYRRT